MDVVVAATSDTGIVAIMPSFKDAAGSPVTSSFVAQFTTFPKVGDKTFASSGWKLSAVSSTTVGSYIMVLTMTDKAGSITTKEVAFVVKSGSTSTGAPTISSFSLSTKTPGESETIAIQGTAEFTTAKATISYSLSGSNLYTIKTSSPYVATASPAALTGSIYLSGTLNGTYTILVTITDENGKSESSSTNFTVGSSTVVGEPLVRKGAVRAGAQGSMYGSFLELSGPDAGTLYTGGAGIPSETIDVVFGVDGSAISLMSPQRASVSRYTLSSWSQLNATDIVDLGTTKPSNTGVVAQALDRKSAQSVPAIAGHYYGISARSGDLSVLFITSLSGTGIATEASIDVYLVDGGSVIDPVDPIETGWKRIDLGAQNAVQASALDVDGQTAYSSGAKTDAEVASIDLLFLASSSGVPTFYSPSEAYLLSLGSLSSWKTKNETYIADAGTSSITSLSQASALAGATNNQSAPAVVGHYYAVEHADGTTSALKVESITGTGKSAVVTVSMKTFSGPF